ncbi:MAG TPA: bacteriohemerythrin [Noviherbaspirillum sp.]|uniref:bacteriohemerythrin n=1 Tax=Noviherbaspirillum sp. TaxID=1926288 RepID=UPI002D25160D|nr:bacteriohemerythrin [Noviherbaspirillum sp.]HYD95356.1 bacteriohemerythrin [Noviherbaspirillum sp.]
MLNPKTTIEQDSPTPSWTKELSIGHEMIDADHQHIFDLAHRVQAEMLEEPEHSIVGEVLVELIEHTGDHFAREEALMEAIQFSGYETHRRQHIILMEKVNNLHRRFMDAHGSLSAEVAEFLEKWLVHHIQTSDMELGRSIRAVK